MNLLLPFLFDAEANSATSEATSASPSDNPGGTAQLLEALKNMVKSPVFYIVIGVIVLLILAFYLYRRVIKGRSGVVTIIIRKGKVFKAIDEKTPKYMMVPFKDKVGAVISLGEKELSSDKLFINDGPDALYRVNYTLVYKVVDPEGFYPYNGKIDGLIVTRINDDLRKFADDGNAMTLVRDYRDHDAEILSLINKAIEEYKVEAVSLKINLIEPMGKR